MNTNTSTFSSDPEGFFNSDSNPSLVRPTSKRGRLIFNTANFEYLGCLEYGTKLLHKQSNSFSVFQYIIKQFQRKSQGGVIPTEINQRLLEEELINGKLVSRRVITKLLKFCLEHKILVKTHQYRPGKNSIFYKGGELMIQLLKPTKKEISQIKKHKLDESLVQYYTDMGFDAFAKTPCRVCFDRNGSIESYNFNIREREECLEPVCKDCKVNHPEATKSAYRLFYVEQDALGSIDIKTDHDTTDPTDPKPDKILNILEYCDTIDEDIEIENLLNFNLNDVGNFYTNIKLG